MMKSLWLIITVIAAFCSNAKATISNKVIPNYSINTQIETGEIRGKVTDPYLGEPLPFVQVKVFLEDIMVTGALTDFDGEFRIANLEPGVYDLLVEHIGYSSKRLEDIKVKQGSITKIDSELLEIEDNVKELKPMIYLYPEEETYVSVQLKYDGQLTHTYPKSDGNWEILASSDGKLTDDNGRNYYGLFWEGTPNDPIQPKCGTVVSRDSLIPFLESSLD
ncbi:MAG: carboxypeptidase-like regulatory domain-containing protein [Fluviicola sp.]